MTLIPHRLKSFRHISEHNWLIHWLMLDFLDDVAQKYSSGIMLDIGCGIKPYHSVFSPYTTKHIGFDLPMSDSKASAANVVGNAFSISIKNRSCNVVLLTEVLEHLEDPLTVIKELHRILKPHGIVIVTAPFFWPLHEAPRDFYRYSEYGLRYLFEKVGFHIVEIRPLTGYIATFAQLTAYYTKRFQGNSTVGHLTRIFNWGLQYLALMLNRNDTSTHFANLYGLVARKP